MTSSNELAPYGSAELSELAIQHVGAKQKELAAPIQSEHDSLEMALWESFLEDRNPQAREQLIMHFMPYARVIAASLYGKHLYHETGFDEYLQLATLGMIEAIDRYDPSKGARFKTYALPRMRGAVMDGLENISERQQQLSLQRQLLSERVASVKRKARNKPESSVLEALSEVGVGVALSFILDGTGMLLSEDAALPDQCYDMLELKQLRARVQDLLKELTPREQAVVKLHYLQGFTFEDVSITLKITKSRVSQLHDQALTRLLKILSCSSRADLFL